MLSFVDSQKRETGIEERSIEQGLCGLTLRGEDVEVSGAIEAIFCKGLSLLRVVQGSKGRTEEEDLAFSSSENTEASWF